MKVFLDSNIVIDAVAGRKPFNKGADALLTLGLLGEFELWFGASQYTDVDYVLRSTESFAPEKSVAALKSIKGRTHTCSLTEDDIDQAIDSGWKDFEDACAYSMASRLGVDYIITRDKTGFTGSFIKVVDCDGFFADLAEAGIIYDEVIFP